MKNILSLILVSAFLFFACSKKESADVDVIQEMKPDYDTAAIDSFSTGATSIDVVRQIRMSSQKYQDSVKQALKLQEEEKRLKAELDKENKKKEEEKKKSDEENKQKKSTESSDGTKTE